MYKQTKHYKEEYYKEEKINSKVYLMSPSGHPNHARTIRGLYDLFSEYLRDKTCEVFTDNIDIYLDEDNYIIPDLSVICDKSKFSSRGYEGAPELIVEVISVTSVKRDRFEKFELYSAFGVKEYWIVDYMTKVVEQYVLTEGKYKIYDVVRILTNDELRRIPEEERISYSTLLTCNVFSDLVINIEDVFNF